MSTAEIRSALLLTRSFVYAASQAVWLKGRDSAAPNSAQAPGLMRPFLKIPYTDTVSILGESALRLTLNCDWPSTDVAQAAITQIATWLKHTPPMARAPSARFTTPPLVASGSWIVMSCSLWDGGR